MSRLALSAACLLVLAPVAPAADPPADPLADAVAKLRKPFRIQQNLSALTLDALFAQLSADTGVEIVINPGTFPPDVNAGETRIRATAAPTGVPTGQALRFVLGSFGADDGLPAFGFLVRRGYVEVVSGAEYARHFQPDPGETPDRVLTVPLASAVVKDRPLADALAALADEYEQTVLLSPKLGEAAKQKVSARLQNVPFDTAVELLAGQADLAVVRKGRAYVVVPGPGEPAVRLLGSPGGPVRR